MATATTTGTGGMGFRWRIVCVLIIVILQVLLVWMAIHSSLRWDSWRLLLFALFTAVLVTSGYDIATKGKPTRFAFFFWLCLALSSFVHDVQRFWNHDPNVDLFFTLFAEAFYVFFLLVCVWRNPFGVKKIDPVAAKRDFT